MTENFRNRKKFFKGVMMRLPVSIMIGSFFWQIAARPSQHSIAPMKGAFMLVVQCPLIESFYAGATIFQANKPLLKKEYYEGLYGASAFYASYYLSFIAMQLPWALAWSLPLYFITGLSWELPRFLVFIAVVFVVILEATAWGSYIGARTQDPDGIRVAFLPFLVPMLIFSGYIIPYYQLLRIWRPFYYLSPVQWGLSILEVNHYSGLVFPDCDPTLPWRSCFATGEEYLTSVGHGMLSVWQMLGICLVYTSLFLFLNIKAVEKHVLNGRI